MKRIFAGEIFEILPQPNSIIFSCFNATVEDNIEVSFKMFSLEDGTLTDATKNIYWIAKFGANYASVLPFCENYVEARVLHLDHNRIFLCGADGRSVLLDSNSKPTWVGELKYRGQVPSALGMDGKNIWAAFASLDTVLRLNSTTLREELRIGKKGSMLEGPIAMHIENNEAFISSSRGKKLVRLDFETFDCVDKYRFEEPVLSFTKIQNREFVLLKSGLYEL